MKLKLKDTTLVCVDTLNYQYATDAVNICKHYCDFEDIKFFTDNGLHPNRVNIPKIDGYMGYSNFILEELPKHIETNFVLMVQWDGFILNPKKWTDEFFEYDYIGALLGPKVLPEIVGNGGFSLRSKKLLDLSKKLTELINIKNVDYSEDLIICYHFRKWFEQQGVKFAPKEVAQEFSTEREEKWIDSFGFHNFNFVNIFKDGWEPPFDIKIKDKILNNFKE